MATAVTPAERPTAHTSTQQWQSFEMRMRQRRIDRLLLRAQIAHEAGRDEEAREALAEAEQLNGYVGSVAELPPPPPVAAIWASDIADSLPTDTTADETLPPAEIGSDAPSRSWMPRVAAVLTVAGALGWFTGPRAPYQPTVAAISESRPPATMLGASTEPRGSEPPAVLLSVADVQAQPAVPAEPSESEDVGRDAASASTSLVTRDNPEPSATTGTPASPRARFLGVAPVAALEASPPPSSPPVVPVASSTVLDPTDPTGPTPPATVPLPPPASPALEAPEPAVPLVRPAAADDTGVRAALARYESAYSRLDADAAGAVWPGLDRRALARAFDGLSSQRVSLGSCDVRVLVSGESAVAECAGSATWTPKIGGGSRNQQRRWQFRLRNGASGWQIVGANVR